MAADITACFTAEGAEGCDSRIEEKRMAPQRLLSRAITVAGGEHESDFCDSMCGLSGRDAPRSAPTGTIATAYGVGRLALALGVWVSVGLATDPRCRIVSPCISGGVCETKRPGFGIDRIWLDDSGLASVWNRFGIGLESVQKNNGENEPESASCDD